MIFSKSQSPISLHPSSESVRVLWLHTATHCNTLQYIATHCLSFLQNLYLLFISTPSVIATRRLHTATHCSTLQHTATHCNTLLMFSSEFVSPIPQHPSSEYYSHMLTTHTAPHCNTLQHTATHSNTLQHTATHCTTLHHTATHCITLRHSLDDFVKVSVSSSSAPLKWILQSPGYYTLQQTAIHCNTSLHCNTLLIISSQSMSGLALHPSSKSRSTVTTHCNTLHHTATHVSAEKLRQPQIFGNVRLVARWRQQFRGFLAIFLVAELPPKRGGETVF